MSKIAKLMQQAAAGAGGAAPVEYVGTVASDTYSGGFSISSTGIQPGDLIIVMASGISGDGSIDDTDFTSMFPSGYPSYPSFSNDTADGFRRVAAYKFSADPVEDYMEIFMDFWGQWAQVMVFRNAGAPQTSPDSILDQRGQSQYLYDMTVAEDGSAAVYWAAIKDNYITSPTPISGWTRPRTGGGSDNMSACGFYRTDLSAGTLSGGSSAWVGGYYTYSTQTYGWIIPPAS